jgi:hypothetical protein
MKIKVYLLNQDRTIITKKVEAGKGFFTHQSGLYCITHSTTLAAKEQASNFNTIPELFYFTDNPLPINEVQGKGADFLESMVIENALKDTGKPSGTWLISLSEKLLLHPAKIMGVLIAIGVGVIVLRVALGGF